MKDGGYDSMINAVDIYKKAIEQFETVIDRITIACLSATEKLDELEGVTNTLHDLARDERDLELTDLVRVSQTLWTQLGGNRETVSKITRNIEHLENTVASVKVARQTLMDAEYVLSGMKASVSAIQAGITHALIDNSDAFESEVQYDAIRLGITGLVNVHERGANDGKEAETSTAVYRLA
jgi:prefoldin subunit 5